MIDAIRSRMKAKLEAPLTREELNRASFNPLGSVRVTTRDGLLRLRYIVDVELLSP